MADSTNCISKLEATKQLSDALHILCPRQDDNDQDRYDDDPLYGQDLPEEPTPENKARVDLLRTANHRRENFVGAFEIFAFDGKDAQPYKDFVLRRLDKILGSCDLCIRNYYTCKLRLRAELQRDYDDEEIAIFFRTLDENEVGRIKAGLQRATKTLKELPEPKRKIQALDKNDLFSVFEALSCANFLQDESLLEHVFDEPFRLLQPKRPLKIGDYVPAATSFLFSQNKFRREWAFTTYTMNIQRSPTTVEFETGMKDIIERQLKEMQSSPNTQSILRFWFGMKYIIEKLEKRQITHCLRALEKDVCMLLIEHLPVNTAALRCVLQTLTLLLEKSSDDFWDAMGAMPHAALIEVIFANSYFDKCLIEFSDKSEFAESSLFDMLSWVAPFMNAVKPASQPAACRTMTRMLMSKAKHEKASSSAKYHCLQAALDVLIRTFNNFMDEQGLKQGATARVVISETRDAVAEHFEDIIDPLPSHANIEQLASLETASLEVVRLSVDVECLFLRLDFLALLRNEKISGQKRVYDKFWTSITKTLSETKWKLSNAILLGFTPLVGLEKFMPRAPGGLTPEREDYNRDFDKVNGFVTKILERLATFSPDHLDNIYKSQKGSMSAVAGLFSADEDVFQTSVDMVKTVSEESSRKEALAHVVEAFLSTITYALCWCLRRIGGMKTFGPVPRSIKTCMDVLDVLCDPSTGMIRSHSLDARGSDAVRQYWRYQWYLLGTVFKYTEQWSNVVSDKEKMTDLCRDTMQFAEALFNEYDVFAEASVKSAKEGEAESIKRMLLDSPLGSPAMALDGMSKWLRLKDDYLVITCVNLVSMLLRRLGEMNITVAQETLSYIEEIVLPTNNRSKLTRTQKAELNRSLEAYTGKSTDFPPQPKKQSSLAQYIGKSATAKGETYDLTGDDDYDNGGVPDDDLRALSSSVELNKAIRPQKPQPQVAPKSSKIAKKERDEAERKAFLDARKKQQEAAKLRNKEALAHLRGDSGIGVETKGQGSGLNGIGVRGKDHTKKSDSSMMVSSDSESESDDEIDKALFGDTMKKATSSGPKPSKAPAPVKIAKQARTAKDMRARLAPDLSGLHRAILSWNFYADSKYPPLFDINDHSAIQNTFPTALAWQNSFEPMLILEAWQTFCAARDDRSYKPFDLKIANRISVDQFLEVGTAIPLSEGKDLGISEGDVVLFSKTKQQNSGPTCLSRVHKIARKKGQMEISYRTISNQNPLASSLTPGVEVVGSKILSLIPLEREYGALSALQYYDLCDEIVRARPSPILEYSDMALDPLARTYSVNQAQAKAVKSAIDNDAFTLIQGPPGSGKTKTICALVGALLTGSLRRPAHASNSAPPTAKKILVCAPSNAAVDELVMRFRRGVTTLDGTLQKIGVVRLGRSDAINAQVKDLTLEELVNARIEATAPQAKDQKPLHEIMMEHQDASNKLISVRSKMDNTRKQGESVTAQDEREFDLWKKKKADLGKVIDERREKENSSTRDADLARRRIQQEILAAADIVCATLSGSGHDMFQNLNIEFETVIIDEAAQCVELSALIPLKYGCSKCILVGDPKQLPPTVFSREAAQFLYERSLFARMAENHPKDVHLLDTQYRMHPHISVFPSKYFYDSRLRDGVNEASRFMPWHHSTLLGPYRFFNVQGNSTRDSHNSLVNQREAEVVMQLYHRLVTDCAGYKFSGKIGVITPYKGQLKYLQREFSRRYGESILSAVEFNTTDAFQGRESEIIIFSCVRSRTEGAKPEGIGFLKDIRRMNVGLTRAKSSLWVLGDANALARGEYWKKLVDDAKSRNLFTDGEGDVLKLLQRPLLTSDMMKPDVDMIDIDMPDPPATEEIPTPPPVISLDEKKPLETMSRHASYQDQKQKNNINHPDSSQSRTSTPAGEKRKRSSNVSNNPDAQPKAIKANTLATPSASASASRSSSAAPSNGDDELPNLRGDSEETQRSTPGPQNPAVRGAQYGNATSGNSTVPKPRPPFPMVKKKNNGDALFIKSKKKY
ncbi:MAG: hypothetical protein Q9227_006428 [Pyrenula ochraceoflavens]